ncbi:MAG: pantetheine-phosphate adenylyltransferase [Candidatus Borkfalkiaceae bacterium]|nr:pantetheine-phosphate adenylyltransferase [Clostridia bacterium]MDY6223241.1 pantetheine-phosphate adenylyltransferase [Christensenellaceae bacterium]
MKKCVFAGTFDPPTLGHKAVVERAAKIFDEVIVAVMINPDKQPLFSAEERIELLKKTMPFSCVRVISSAKTAAELMSETGADCYLRGIRNGTDFDYETANYYVSEKLCGEFVAMYVPCPQNLLHVSSSAVRALLKFSKNVDGYVAPEAKEALLDFYRAKNTSGGKL